MEFKKVYSSLLDLFPQVDPRALKAVAIEHSKDADAAFLAVHQEIIPFFNQKRINTIPQNENERSFVSAIANSPKKQDCPMVGTANSPKKEDCPMVGTDADFQLKRDKLNSGLRIPSEFDMLKLKLDSVKRIPSDSYTLKLKPDKKLARLGLAQSSNVDKKLARLGLAQSSNVDSGKRIPLDMKLKLDSGKRIPSDFDMPLDIEMHNLLKLKLDKLTARLGDKCPETSQLELDRTIQDKDEDVSEEEEEESHSESSEEDESHSEDDSEDSESHSEDDSESHSESSEDDSSDEGSHSESFSDEESHSESSFADDNDLVGESDSFTIDKPSETMQESNLDMRNIVATHEDMSQSSQIHDIDEIIADEIATEDESVTASIYQSRQIHDIDEIIANARSNKKTLFSSMETVIDLIRQVDVKEKAAEQAKFEAERGGMDTLFKVNELKQMLEYAKKGNCIDAGDVYGEKAILATELRELQSRVFSLSDERDESLAVLDEMRQTLELQLAAIEIEIKSAEQEKLDKESAALKLLADQELAMEKVVQESKKLKQLTAENARLQEFLTDRGRTVDALQGEIAVICQDVMLLKEKFDLNLPLSESFFPSLTSFGLASSISSVKSLVPDQVQALPVGDDDLIETPKNRDHVDDVTEDDRKALEDEGWELF